MRSFPIVMTVTGCSAPLTIRTIGISNIKMRASDIRKAGLCATPDNSVNIERPKGKFQWRWCHKCQGMFFGGNPGPVCPAGGAHDGAGSGNYTLPNNIPAAAGQHGWSWRHKCQGLFFGGNPGPVCPASGAHDSAGSGDYSLLVN